jgi:aromatic-L-amino-acid decarboxylase
MLPHPDLSQLQNFLHSLTAWALDDFATLPDRPFGQAASRPELETLLREPPPALGQSLEEVFQQFQEKIAPFAFRPQHPRFLAFIPGAPTFVSVLGDWLCAASNYFCGVWLEAAAPAQVEILVLDWFKEFLGYPAEARGILTSGGSEANLLALVVARETLPWTIRDQAMLYVSGQRHWSIDRAARIMGLHPEQIRPLPFDAQGRLAVDALHQAMTDDRKAGRHPWAVVANAGATNTGAVDPLADLADYCRSHHLWLHVDAAYGWAAVLDNEGKKILQGIDLADSITLDPHKWFAQTFDVGCVLIRTGPLLPAAFTLRPEYMQDVIPAENEINFADHGLALTRRFRALKIWFSLKVLGLDWFRQLVQHCCQLAHLAQRLLEETGLFEIFSPAQLSIVCFRYVPSPLPDANPDLNRLNLALCEKLRLTGRAFLSTTLLADRVALRMCFVNWRTTPQDVADIVHLLVQLAKSPPNP